MRLKGIRDKIAIISCDASKYGEGWDKSQYDLLFEVSHQLLKTQAL